MLNKTFFIVPILCLFCTVTSFAANVNYLAADALKTMFDNNQRLVIADIQKPGEFKKHHFYSAIETAAYPVKTEARRQRLDKVVEMYEKTGNPIVIVGPRGTSASKRAYQYLLDQDVDEDEIFILKGGIKDWPYKEFLIDMAGGCA